MDVLVDQDEHLAAGSFLPLLGVDGLDLHPSEEALRGRVVRRAALRAHGARQPIPFHECLWSNKRVRREVVTFSCI